MTIVVALTRGNLGVVASDRRSNEPGAGGDYFPKTLRCDWSNKLVIGGISGQLLLDRMRMTAVIEDKCARAATVAALEADLMGLRDRVQELAGLDIVLVASPDLSSAGVAQIRRVTFPRGGAHVVAEPDRCVVGSGATDAVKAHVAGLDLAAADLVQVARDVVARAIAIDAGCGGDPSIEVLSLQPPAAPGPVPEGPALEPPARQR